MILKTWFKAVTILWRKHLFMWGGVDVPGFYFIPTLWFHTLEFFTAPLERKKQLQLNLKCDFMAALISLWFKLLGEIFSFFLEISGYV